MERWKNPDQYNLDGITGIVFFALAGSFILMLCHPKETTKLVLFGRSIISIFVCYMIVIRFDGKKMCTEPLKIQIKFFKSIFVTRQCIINLYICMSMFLTPFCSRYFTTFISSSVYFAIEMVLLNKYYDSSDTTSLIFIPMWWTLMFIQTYFIRHLMTECFVMEMEAEKTRDSIT